MRPYREIEGRAIRHAHDDEGHFPCGCCIIFLAIVVVAVAALIERFA